MTFVKSNLEELIKAKSDADSLRTTSSLCFRLSKAFSVRVTNVANKFTSEEMVELHYADFMPDRSNYAYEHDTGKTTPDGKPIMETRYNDTQRKADGRDLALKWLEGKKEEIKGYLDVFDNAFKDQNADLNNVNGALQTVFNKIQEFEDTSYSLEEAVEAIPGLVGLKGLEFNYDSEFATQGIPNVSVLSFLDIEGGSTTIDTAVTLGGTMVWGFSTAFLNGFKDGLTELISGGTLNDILSSTGSFWTKVAESGYFNSKKTLDEFFTGAYPSAGGYNAEEVKEENDEWYLRVYGITPEEAAENLGLDTGAAVVGPAIVGPAMVALANSDDSDPVLDDDRASKLVKDIGSEKTLEEVKTEAEAVREEIREQHEREAEEAEKADTEVVDETPKETQHRQEQHHTDPEPHDEPQPTHEDPISYDPVDPIIDTGGRLNPPTPKPVSQLTQQPVTPQKVDNLALDEFYNRDASAIETERAELLEMTEDAYNGINVDQFKETLSKGGYSTEDINYILEHKEVGFTALVMASQASALTDLSSSLANSQGMSAFASTYSEGLRLEDLLNGRAQASLGVEMDPDVSSARSTMSSMRNNYNDSVNKANESIKQAEDDKASLDKIRQRIIKKSGTDSSNWSDEEVKEYNDAVNKYNDSNAKANADVAEANRLKGDLEKFESEFEELKNKKFDELLKEYQDGAIVKPTDDTGGTVDPTGPGEVSPTDPGTNIPGGGEQYDGSDQAILGGIVGGQDGLVIGDGGLVGGVQQVTDPITTQPSIEVGQQGMNPGYDGSDQAILGGLNLGGGDLSIGAPDPGVRVDGATMNMNIPGGQAVNNVRVNSNAFVDGGYVPQQVDDRVIPGLGLDVNMSTITGGNVNGISVSAPSTRGYSDAAILNGLTAGSNSLSTGSSNSSGYQPIETPTLNSLPSSGFDQALSGFASTESEREERRETPKKNDNSRFVEPPTKQEQENRKPPVSVPETRVENGISIEIGEDGSLRL